MELPEIRILVRERLDEYIQLGMAGKDIDLNELSSEIEDILTELSGLGVTIYDRGVPVESVQIGVNEFGVVLVRINGK